MLMLALGGAALNTHFPRRRVSEAGFVGCFANRHRAGRNDDAVLLIIPACAGIGTRGSSFIAHNMGGLTVKSRLCNSASGSLSREVICSLSSTGKQSSDLQLSGLPAVSAFPRISQVQELAQGWFDPAILGFEDAAGSGERAYELESRDVRGRSTQWRRGKRDE